jgi:cytolysin-activating lysine-acyltransferase
MAVFATMSELNELSTIAFKSPAEALGLAVFIASKATRYQNFRTSEIVATLLPPITCSQYAVFACGSDLAGFATWAFMSDVDLRSYAYAGRSIPAGAWRSGENLWIADFVAPAGHARQMVRHLRQTVFRDRRHASGLRRRPDNSIRRLCHYVARPAG